MSAGCMIANTPLCIDFWKDQSSNHIYLLSHAHRDHTDGLTPKWSHPIYCSQFTADYVSRTLGVNRELFRPLELNSPHVISLDGVIGDETMSLTLIDANHCAGSVMFIIEGYFGVILYTGDFRYDNGFKNCESSEILYGLSGNVDILYLDNTYCSPSCVFESRGHCTNDIVDIINNNPHAAVVIAVRTLGKEDLLSDIAVKTNEWISVTHSMYKTMEALNLQENFVVNDEKMCRVITAPFYSVNEKNIRRWNEKKRTIGIIPSAVFTGRYEGRTAAISPYLSNLHIVNYSDHSSFSEPHAFVSFIRPKRVIPIVTKNITGAVDNRCDMACFEALLNPETKRLYDIPSSVQFFMKDKIPNCYNMTCKTRKARFPPYSVKRRQPLGVVFIDSSPEKLSDQ